MKRYEDLEKAHKALLKDYRKLLEVEVIQQRENEQLKQIIRKLTKWQTG